jgi:hypothetical protein
MSETLKHAKDLDAPEDPTYLISDEGPEPSFVEHTPEPEVPTPWWYVPVGIVVAPIGLPILFWLMWDVLHDFGWAGSPPLKRQVQWLGRKICR